MDPSLYMQYTSPNVLPQESKLATYMNRNTSSSTQTQSLNQAMSNLGLESSPTAAKKAIMNNYVPINYYGPSTSMMPETPDNSPPMNMAVGPPTTPQVHQENVGGTTYFYATNTDNINNAGGLNASASIGPEPCLGAGVPHGAAQPNPYASHMYAGSMAPGASHIGQNNTKPNDLAATFYLPDCVRNEIYQRIEENYMQPEILPYPDLPQNVEIYTDLIPLENWAPHATSFRVTHRQNGDYYAMRRLHGFTAAISKRFSIYKSIEHPNIVRLFDVFTTTAFGDHSLVLVYEYFPTSLSLFEKYLAGNANGNPSDHHDPFSSDPDAPRPYTHRKNAMLRAVASGALLPEAVLWSLLVQLTAALRTLHTAGLACRSLDASKVIMNSCRVRISWCGSADALLSNANDVLQAQQDDLTALGRLVLTLACRSMHCDNLPASLDLVTRSYSSDLKNVIVYLLSSTQPHRTITDLMPMIGARFYTQVEALERRADELEDQLAKQVDNGRIMRMFVKMGVINERPELNMDTSWCETGDRYMLKLFRDYIFHSVTEDGRPWIDLTHIIYCLNQLDSGSNNKVELMSRDEQSVLVVSYAELKHCLEQAFDEVEVPHRRSKPPPPLHPLPLPNALPPTPQSSSPPPSLPTTPNPLPSSIIYPSPTPVSQHATLPYHYIPDGYEYIPVRQATHQSQHGQYGMIVQNPQFALMTQQTRPNIEQQPPVEQEPLVEHQSLFEKPPSLEQQPSVEQLLHLQPSVEQTILQSQMNPLYERHTRRQPLYARHPEQRLYAQYSPQSLYAQYSQQPLHTQYTQQPLPPQYTQQPLPPQYTQQPLPPQYTQQPQQPLPPQYTQQPLPPQYTQQPLRPQYTQQPLRTQYTQQPHRAPFSQHALRGPFSQQPLQTQRPQCPLYAQHVRYPLLPSPTPGTSKAAEASPATE